MIDFEFVKIAVGPLLYIKINWCKSSNLAKSVCILKEIHKLQGCNSGLFPKLRGAIGSFAPQR